MFFLKDGASPEDVLKWLTATTQFDRDEFDRESLRPFSHLLRQYEESDLTLVWLSPSSTQVMNDLHRNIQLRFPDISKSRAHLLLSVVDAVPPELYGNVMTIRMTLDYQVEYADLRLLEVGRVYNKPDGRRIVVPGVKQSAGTETRKRTELRPKTIRRAAWEELRISIDDVEVEELTTHEEPGEIHRSSVYHRFLAQQLFLKVKFILPRLMWPHGRSYVDDGVEIFQQWFRKDVTPTTYKGTGFAD